MYGARAGAGGLGGPGVMMDPFQHVAFGMPPPPVPPAPLLAPPGPQMHFGMWMGMQAPPRPPPLAPPHRPPQHPHPGAPHGGGFGMMWLDGMGDGGGDGRDRHDLLFAPHMDVRHRRLPLRRVAAGGGAVGDAPGVAAAPPLEEIGGRAAPRVGRRKRGQN